jgi:hypothetical protein
MLATEARYQAADAKRLYYLSREFLMGQSLSNNLYNLGIWRSVDTRSPPWEWIWRRSWTANPMPRWATAASVAWQPVFWILWRLWAEQVWNIEPIR